VDFGAVASELQKTRNRLDIGELAEMYAKFFPKLALLMACYTKAQAVVTDREQLDSMSTD
jgi:hypothetical protein